MESAQVATGFMTSLAGVVAVPFAYGYTLFLCAIGTLICATGLVQARRAKTRYPRLAIAGLVLGVIGFAVGFVVAIVAGSGTPS
jgi:4-hydroxybenzoate polyprenyltransferase